MTWKIGWQSANTEEERKKNKMGFGDKSDPQSVHAPHIQGGDTKKKLKPPRNDLFNHWNQLHASSEDNRAANPCAARVNLCF